MKQTITAFLILIAFQLQAQPIFTYGSRAVSKEEFLRAFNKNNSNDAKSEKAYRDYLELYVRFKLKVQAAYDLHLDTIASQRSELQNFRGQIIENYMTDESSIQVLVDEAFQRSQRDIRVSHIFIPFQGGDTTAAYERANEAYGKLKAGVDFGTVAIVYSSDPNVQVRKGDLGWLTAFTIPYEFENIAYNTAVGQVSAPYRSRSAYHIFKVAAERPGVGRMRAAQILLGFTPDMDPSSKEKRKILADSIYQALQGGASFAEMVARYSTDNVTYQAGGQMQEFGAGRYSEDFEKAVFSLSKDGEISKPFLSSFGYHIIMRISRVPIPADKNDAAAMAKLKQSVLADKRMLVAKQMLALKAMKITGYKPAPFDQKALLSYADSLYAAKKPRQLPAMNDKTLLFSFPEQKITAGDFGKYITSIRSTPDLMRGKSTPQILQQYTESVAMDYYRSRLERYNKEFAYQLREFKDGNLLFEIMQRKVWEKAAADSAGLKRYYQEHKDKYWWEASASVILFTCSDSLSAEKAKKAMNETPGSWKSLVQNSDGTIQADSGRFELLQLPVVVSKNPKGGFVSAPVKGENDNSYSFVYLIKTFPDKAPRNFDEARGFVINDYQSAVEDKWIAELKKKYPVKVNEPVLQTCWK